MILGIDINPFYQEQAQYGKLINWPALKDDPLGLSFIWIKVAEGTDGTDYVEGAAREVKGALGVGFEAVNPYHYYLYQWCDWSSGAAVWRVISAVDQAKAFYDAAKAAGFPAGKQMSDLEDPLIDQFLQWSDTASINKAIAFARKLNAHLKAYHEAIDTLFGKKTNPYSGKWWLDKWVPLLVNNGYAAEVAWLAERYWILADYDGTLNIPSYIPGDHIIAWQETSTPKIPVQGIPTGRSVPGDALDIDQWMLSEDEFLAWSGQKAEVQLTTLPDINVKQTDRAKVLTIRPNQTYAVADLVGKVDAVILPMGGMASTTLATGHWLPYVEQTFQGRAKQIAGAGIPVIGSFELDAGSLLKEQHTASEIDGKDIRGNFVLTKLMDGWHDGAWTWDSIFAKHGTFIPISALELKMTTMDGYPAGSITPNDWQARTFRLVANHVKYLIDNGMVPGVPVEVYTGPWWLKYYSDTVAGIIPELVSRNSWLWLRLGEWIFQSTAVFPTLADIFANRPPEDFRFGKQQDDLRTDGTILKQWTVPDGFVNRVAFDEYTGEKQRCGQIKNADGTPSDVNASLYRSTAAELAIFLKATPVLPPGGGGTTTTVDLAPVLAAIAALDAKLDALKADATINRQMLMDEELAFRARFDGVFK